jgi:hypothetical protein
MRVYGIPLFITYLCHVRGIDNPVADALSCTEANALTQSSLPVRYWFSGHGKSSMEGSRTSNIVSQSRDVLFPNHSSFTPYWWVHTLLWYIYRHSQTTCPSTSMQVNFFILSTLYHTLGYVLPDMLSPVNMSGRRSTKMSIAGLKPLLTVSVLKLPDTQMPHDDVQASRCTFWYCTHRPHGTSSILPRVSVPPHMYRLVYSMVGGISSHRYYSLVCGQIIPLGWNARFGVPSTVITDRGGKFELNLWTQLNYLYGIHRQCTTAYHPAANGMVERFHLDWCTTTCSARN